MIKQNGFWLSPPKRLHALHIIHTGRFQWRLENPGALPATPASIQKAKMPLAIFQFRRPTPCLRHCQTGQQTILTTQQLGPADASPRFKALQCMQQLQQSLIQGGLTMTSAAVDSVQMPGCLAASAILVRPSTPGSNIRALKFMSTVVIQNAPELATLTSTSSLLTQPSYGDKLLPQLR